MNTNQVELKSEERELKPITSIMTSNGKQFIWDPNAKPLTTEELLQKRVDEYNAEEKPPRDGIGCPACKNKGLVAFFRLGDVAYSMRKCDCNKQIKIVEQIKNSGFGSLLDNRLEDFKTDNEVTKVLKKKAEEYIHSDLKNWFVTLGQTGAGKTTICSCVCNKLLAQGKKVYYLSWNEFVRTVKLLANTDEFSSYWNKHAYVEVLYLDDLLKGAFTETDKRYMFDLLNIRYNNRYTTIISSERTIQEIAEEDDAAAGRINQMAGDYLIKISKNRAYDNRADFEWTT